MGEADSLPPHIHRQASRLLVDSAAEEAIQAFFSAEIRSILLKGASVVRWLYEEEAQRTYGDADILISSGDFSAAEQVLSALGYVPADPPHIPGDRPRHADAWRRHLDGMSIDLHRTIIGVGSSPEDTWDVLSGCTERLVLRKHAVDILAQPARAVQLALHAAHHGPGTPQPIEDLARVLQALTSQQWREAAVIANRLDATNSFCQGLSLIPAGRELLDKLSLSAPPTVEGALREDATPTALGLYWLSQERSPGRKLRLLFRKAFPPRPYLIDWWPPAGKSRTFLLIGYIRRVGFLLRHTGPALVALGRARRRASISAPSDED